MNTVIMSKQKAVYNKLILVQSYSVQSTFIKNIKLQTKTDCRVQIITNTLCKDYELEKYIR